MNVLLFDRNEYDRLYNCSTYEVSDVPLEKRQHPLLGCLFLMTFTIYEGLYIPCLLAISRHLDQTPYVFMFYIGLVDIACLWINGFFTGLFAIQGYVFCSSPALIYALGSLGLTFWIAESTGAILLAASRCLEIWSPALARSVFARKYAMAWLLPPSIFSLYYTFFTKPVAFTGIYVSWFFNPHVGYVKNVDLDYENFAHSAHNFVLLVTLIGIYFAFCCVYYAKLRTVDPQQRQPFWQRKAFIQAVLISFVNATAAAVYVYMQYTTPSEALIVVGQLSWHSAHGLPAIIYLTMNDTLRNDVARMLCGNRQNRRVTGASGTGPLASGYSSNAQP